ncbi:hypothetical protein KDW82_33365 [Burkholderia vietnamiensis]|uniref:hypothetical protein n=1 Tax=Burkholderia vietnamiensis TaxID=60552 RepID=UPI0012DAABE8|nr:hypothetical protein [Burkholderia vietnamiensis]MBR8193911.1 hypothetical protein [Burkholderia vietnamiensis]MCA8073858.1 hypothetical protein [Burkholderia vietnamiensis]MCA8232034.1 hypothetical protein [Burkholderia vietnamiensis]UEB99945.1 hypothetical protein LK462_15025 [Burkholderia vietnamiensis]HDR8991197.1 hypothetical protein [Burkholderia vietnamiensis]
MGERRLHASSQAAAPESREASAKSDARVPAMKQRQHGDGIFILTSRLYLPTQSDRFEFIRTWPPPKNDILGNFVAEFCSTNGETMSTSDIDDAIKIFTEKRLANPTRSPDAQTKLAAPHRPHTQSPPRDHCTELNGQL